MYSSGEDSWEDEKWSRHPESHRRQRLEVPGSRSRSSSHSMSPRRPRPGSSGRRSPDSRSHKRTSPTPRTPRKAISPRKSPSPRSEKGRKSPNPFGSPVGRRASGRSRHEDDYPRRRSPRRHSPDYERGGRRSLTPEDYRRGRRSQSSKYEDGDRWERSPHHHEDRFKYRKPYTYQDTETESQVEEPRRKKSSKKESKHEEADFASHVEKTMNRDNEKASVQEKIQESAGKNMLSVAILICYFQLFFRSGRPSTI